MAIGVLNAMENDKVNVKACRELYKRRIDILKGILIKHGMRLAIEPGAGFFTLWQRPDQAFGQVIKDAEHFNYLMIEKPVWSAYTSSRTSAIPSPGILKRWPI